MTPNNLTERTSFFQYLSHFNTLNTIATKQQESVVYLRNLFYKNSFAAQENLQLKLGQWK